jgi:hypothetical protein
MTPEEEQKLKAYILRMQMDPGAGPITMESQVNAQLSQPVPQGMINQSSTPGGLSSAAQGATRDLSGQEAAIKQQQAYANSMRGGAAPEGRNVGPSGIYVGPNWGKQVGYLAKQAMGGYAAAQANKADQALAPQRQQKAMDMLRYQQQLTEEERGFKSGESQMDRDLRKGISEATNLVTTGEGAANRGARANQGGLDRSAQMARTMAGIEGDIGAADALDERKVDAAQTARENDWVDSPYMVNGKLQTVSQNPNTGENRWGGSTGPLIPPEVMQNAIAYTPGQASGTTADTDYMDKDPATAGASSPDFMGNLLTSDTFESGIFNPARWGAEVGVGPEGEFAQATQRQMGTATLGALAQRMQDINLRPWTPKEIETISADFPSKNDRYPSWANFTYNNLRPSLAAKYREAEAAGVTPSVPKEELFRQMDYDILKGAENQGIDLMKLAKNIGMPDERLREYLRSISE